MTVGTSFTVCADDREPMAVCEGVLRKISDGKVISCEPRGAYYVERFGVIRKRGGVRDDQAGWTQHQSGITAWFMPAEVEGRVGGAVVHHAGAEMTSSGTVTAYDPPHRFAYEEADWTPEGADASKPMATEFLVEARSGGTCVVRVVMSGFGDGEAWERAIESFTAGWRQALGALRLYLTHFRGEAVSAVTAGTVTTGDKDAAWSALTGALGLPADPQPGERIATSAPDAPALAGTVEEAAHGMITLVLDEPARGLGLVGAGGPGDEVYMLVRAQLFGSEAADVAAREQERWEAWFAGHTLAESA